MSWSKLRGVLGDGRGLSLIEILIGVIILSVALLALAAAGGGAARRVHQGRQEMRRWVVLQQQMEEVLAVGYDSVTAGSATVQGYPLSWTVTGSDPKQITMVMQRENHAGQTVEDTVVTYMANPSGS